MYTEQAPNRDSRVRLGATTDALGLPKLVVDWQVTELDHVAFRRTVGELQAAFRRAGLGQLDFARDPLSLDDATDTAHHMGTTRMARSQSEGVVDADLRVFGTANLFVVSSSVFATAPGSSPTFTILALARRLSARLLELRNRRQVAV